MKTFEAVPDGMTALADELPSRESAARLPDGAYTTFRTHHGTRVLRLADHARRLEESARLKGQAGELTIERLRRAIADAIAATGYDESRLRVTWAPPRLFVSLEPFAPYPESLYRDGVRCVTVPLRRDNPRAKDTRFIQAAGAAYDRLPDGVHEGLMVDADGTLLEGLSSNFFAVRDGALLTEQERVLAGLTRSLVLEVAQGLLPLASRGLRVEELPDAQECFVTSASRGVMPVVAVDGVTIGAGAPGPVAREIRERYERRVEEEAEDVGKNAC